MVSKIIKFDGHYFHAQFEHSHTPGLVKFLLNDEELYFLKQEELDELIMVFQLMKKETP